ncbi:ribosome hibernation-promoting factor, HPF/YfiA family [Pelagibacterium xiamenense]|uniref:ribosome hibernation-promoting factor, HPF/YfiA family n=1 Tax=Pelagibacterium xiamenense TaxID=2901140 RepID=UPI001E37F429|nr:ribosome-associated translation inhibitor RaiA [Pelagibacterium xiamenense]MCD7058559.1 ribosome-associated translation inhibitor RaiA [Pelagibacterium xiamenense]
MSLRVSGKNMDVGESLRTTAEDHIDAVVGKYFDGGYDGQLTLEPEGIGFRADCMVHLDTGVVLSASATANDATSAYETMAAHIEKRLRRYKRKLKNHRRNANGTDAGYADYVIAFSDDEIELDENDAPPVIAETTQSLRTMSVGEAVMELDLSQSDVIVFRHAGHGGMNVVYRRADGNIGWIDPALSN